MILRVVPRARPIVLAVVVTLVVAACLPSQLANHGVTPPPAATALAQATASPDQTPSGGSPAPSPTAGGTPSASPSAPSSPVPTPSATPAPTPKPKPKPARGPVTVSLIKHPAAAFITEIQKTWCAASGTQMVLAFDGKVDLRQSTQAAIRRKAAGFWTYADSHTPGWGPGMMAKTLAAYGVPGYQVRTYRTRAAALLDAAKAVERYHQPVLLLVWWGAHTWVMTGFKATQDPLAYKDSVVTGTYILDPWYPRISSIWGPSDPPGTFQDASEMVRNYIRWTRPEGHYPGRDGMFVAVLPTRPAP